MEQTDSDSAQPKPPAWMVSTVGGLILFGVLALFSRMADTAVYFGFSHHGWIIVLMPVVGIVSSFVAAAFLWRYNLDSQQGAARFFDALLRGLMAGGLMTLAIYCFATTIDHWILFHTATTRTLTDVEAPIAKAYVSDDRHHSEYVRLPPLPLLIRIREDDYRRMGNPTLGPGRLEVDGQFCARVTLQVSGRSVRLLGTDTVGLPVGSIHPCPVKETNVLAHLPRM